MARIHAFCLICLAAAVSGCALTPTPADTRANRIDIDSYRLLGDLALSRQRGEEAAQNYLNAALLSDDSSLAERAVQLASGLGYDAIGLQAVARWRELEPQNSSTDYFSGIFETRSGRIDLAIEDFSIFLDALRDSELGRGFALILDALNTESAARNATAIMLELTSRFPGTREGHYGLAQLAMRAGGFGLAVEESEAAVALAPDWADAQLLLARSLLLAGRSEEALTIASELADEVDNSAIRLQFAELLLSAGEIERAEALLNDILRAEPGMPEAIRAMAFLSMSKQDLDLAREQFEMLRNNTDYRDEAFFYLGSIAETESDYLRATRAYSRVTNGLRAVEAQVRTSAILYQEMDDGESALRHLREFGNANPRFAPEMLLAQAELLLEMDRSADAFTLIDTAVASDGENANQALQNAHVSFYSRLMEDALDDGDIEAAQQWITEGLTTYPDNPNLLYSEARLLQEQGRLRRAVGLLEDLVEEYPDDPVFLNALGYLLTDKLGRHEEARDLIQRALALNPESGAILDSMGWVLFRLGEYELALDYLQRAYRAFPDPEVTAHLVDVHWAMGNQALALRMLQDGLAESPEDPFLSEVLQRLQQ